MRTDADVYTDVYEPDGHAGCTQMYTNTHSTDRTVDDSSVSSQVRRAGEGFQPAWLLSVLGGVLCVVCCFLPWFEYRTVWRSQKVLGQLDLATNPVHERRGVLAFGPQGVLFVGDAKSAAVFAIGTGDTEGDPSAVQVNVEALDQKLATALGVGPGEVEVNDLAVNPLSGNVYLSVTKGGTDGRPGLVKIDTTGAIGEIPLENVWFSKAQLPDAPADEVTGEGRRRRNLRDESITDLAFVDGQVIVSGLSNRDAASGVRSLAFPFADQAAGSSLEIYHGAHGRSEDYAAIRTFVPFVIDGQPNLLAGFTCTPLVRFPLDEVATGEKIRGTTVAELGNRNQPLDMIVYQQGDKNYLLLSNSARGVMKVSTEDIENNQGITERVEGGGTAGQPYETIEDWQGVVQMDRLNDTHAVIIVRNDAGAMQLRTVALP